MNKTKPRKDTVLDKNEENVDEEKVKTLMIV